MNDVSDVTGIELVTLKHMLAVAENDAALALRESTRALIAWGDAMAAFRDGSGTVETAAKAEEEFDAALSRRIRADAKVEYLQKQIGARS